MPGASFEAHIPYPNLNPVSLMPSANANAQTRKPFVLGFKPSLMPRSRKRQNAQDILPDSQKYQIPKVVPDAFLKADIPNLG